MNLNWGLVADQPDFANAFAKGYERGQGMAKQRIAQNALAALQQNPDDPRALNALAGVDADAAKAIIEQRKMMKEARAGRLMADGARAALGVPQPAPPVAMGDAEPPPPTGTSAVGPGAPEMAPQPMQPASEPGEIVVEAQRPPSANEYVAQLFEFDPPMAMKLWEFSQKATDQQKAAVIAQQDALAAAATALAGIPYAQRRAALQQFAPALMQRGVPMETIAAFDPTDANIQLIGGQALGVKGILEQRDRAADNARQDAEFAYRQANDARQAAITMRGQDMTDARARQSNAMAAAGISRSTIKNEADLRKEFNALPEVKDWRDVTTSYRQIREATKPGATAQDDIAAIFSYMKMLDPGSVVREGEFATAQNAAGVPDQVRNMWNRLQSGERLNDSQRRNMVESAAKVVLSRRDRFNNIAGQFRSYAADYGVNPDRVATLAPVVNPKPAKPSSNPTRAAGGTLTPARNGVREWRPN